MIYIDDDNDGDEPFLLCLSDNSSNVTNYNDNDH